MTENKTTHEERAVPKALPENPDLRFLIIVLVAAAITSYFYAYFTWIKSKGMFAPEPSDWALWLEFILFGVVFLLCLPGLAGFRDIFPMIPFSTLLPAGKKRLVTGATFSLIALIAMPCFTLGGPQFSGFIHPLIGLGSFAIIVTGSNYVRWGILSACVGACIASFLAAEIFHLTPKFRIPIEDLEWYEKMVWRNDLFHIVFALLIIALTVVLTFDPKDKLSYFEKIAAASRPPDEQDIEAMAMNLDPANKIKLINMLENSIQQDDGSDMES